MPLERVDDNGCLGQAGIAVQYILILWHCRKHYAQLRIYKYEWKKTKNRKITYMMA